MRWAPAAAIVRLGGAGVNGALAHFPPARLVKPHGVIDPLEVSLTTVGEEETLTDAELPHYVRDQDYTRLGAVTDAAGELDGGTEQVLVFHHRLASAEAYANADRRIGVLYAIGSEPSLDGDGAIDPA